MRNNVASPAKQFRKAFGTLAHHTVPRDSGLLDNLRSPLRPIVTYDSDVGSQTVIAPAQWAYAFESGNASSLDSDPLDRDAFDAFNARLHADGFHVTRQVQAESWFSWQGYNFGAPYAGCELAEYHVARLDS